MVKLEATVQKINNRIHLIDPLVFDTQGYLALYFVSSEKPLLFDVGPSSVSDRVIGAIEGLGFKGTDLQYLFISHVHTDHAGGVRRMSEWAPNAKVVVAQSGARHLIDPTKTYQSFVSLLQEYGSRVGDFKGLSQDRLLMAPVELDLGSEQARVIAASGHAHHQICLKVGRHLLAADLMGSQIMLDNHYLPTSAPPSFDYLKYNEDLDRVLSLDIDSICLAHYGAHPDVTTLITDSIDSVKWLRAQVDPLLKEGLSPEEASEAMIRRHLRSEQRIPYRLAYLHARANILGLIGSLQRIQASRG